MTILVNVKYFRIITIVSFEVVFLDEDSRTLF